MKLKKIISALLTVVLLVSTYSSVIVTNAIGNEQKPLESSLDGQDSLSELAVIENSKFRLSVMENGSFSLTDISSGKTAYSRSKYSENDNYSSNLVRQLMNTEIVIDYYSNQDALISDTSSTAYGNEAVVTVSNNNNTVKVNYYFETYDIGFDVNYSLDNSYLAASIDLKSLKEEGDFSLRKITLLPAFFAGTGDDNGYILVPDGSGALINFNNGASNTYSADVYGEEISVDVNMQKSYGYDIKLPVFGMVNNGFGMLAIIDGGDGIAQISAASKNDVNFYNYVNSTVELRTTYLKKMFTAKDSTNSSAYKKISQFDTIDSYTVRYYLIGEDADYVDMANIYRDYLKEEKGLKKGETSSDLNVEVIGAIDVKANFLGFTYYKNKALTTYNQAENLIKKLNKSGIEDVTLKFIGWNNNGLTNNKPLNEVSVMKVLGGKKGFKNLNSFSDKNSAVIDYDIDLLKFYKGGNKYKVSTPFNEQITFNRYLRSVYAKDIAKRSWFLLSPKYISSNYSKTVRSLEKLDMKNISLSSLSNMLYSDFNNKDTVTRLEMMNSVVKILSENKNFNISGSNANAYTIPYLSKVYSSPTYSSGYQVLDEEIPFYQIVFHGYVDMTNESQFISDNRDINYLKAVETGIQLLYTGIGSSTSNIVDTDYDYLYGTNFDLWFDDAVEKYGKYKPLLEKIHDKTIVSHKKLDENVYATRYENGIEVVVNYNDTDVIVNGTTVKSYDFIEREVK